MVPGGSGKLWGRSEAKNLRRDLKRSPPTSNRMEANDRKNTEGENSISVALFFSFLCVSSEETGVGKTSEEEEVFIGGIE